jgi:SAM-dependent methyltransferase
MKAPTRYTEGDYLEQNPEWHRLDSAWKAGQILRILQKNQLAPQSVGEVGCGAGEILKHLQDHLDDECCFWGYEISPQAYALCQEHANERLQFVLGDFLIKADRDFDVLLLIDLIEHLEDYFTFLRQIRSQSEYKIIHIPLELSVQNLLWMGPILQNRQQVGHLHTFCKETALQTLRDVEYEIIDFCYTASGSVPSVLSWRNGLARLPRKFFFALHPDWAVRILGGYSLLVLAR